MPASRPLRDAFKTLPGAGHVAIDWNGVKRPHTPTVSVLTKTYGWEDLADDWALLAARLGWRTRDIVEHFATEEDLTKYLAADAGGENWKTRLNAADGTAASTAKAEAAYTALLLTRLNGTIRDLLKESAGSHGRDLRGITLHLAVAHPNAPAAFVPWMRAPRLLSAA